MWVEFVVGSRPSSEGFSPGSPVFLPPQKQTFPNFNSTDLETVERRVALWNPLKFPLIDLSFFFNLVGIEGYFKA